LALRHARAFARDNIFHMAILATIRRDGTRHLTTAPRFLHNNNNQKKSTAATPPRKSTYNLKTIHISPQNPLRCLLSGPQTTTAPSSSPSSKSWHPTAHRSTSSKPPGRSSTTAGLSAPSGAKLLHPNYSRRAIANNRVQSALQQEAPNARARHRGNQRRPIDSYPQRHKAQGSR